MFGSQFILKNNLLFLGIFYYIRLKKFNTIKKLTLILTLLIFACSSDDSSNNNYNSSQFEGDWSGTFDGGDSGTWTVTVDSNGSAVGNGYSNLLEEPFSATGTFSSNGSVTLTTGNASTGATFTGQANSSSVDGVWNNEGAELSGTWSGSKN
jgi:hypothetical protein